MGEVMAMKDLLISYLLAVMAAIAHLLAIAAFLSSLARELGEKQTFWDNVAHYVIILLIWWVVFSLLLEVMR
jgi:predicted hydrolase (HD superfamily)